MGFIGNSEYNILLNAVAVASTATAKTDWVDCTSGYSYTVWAKGSSVAGTIDFDITVEVSPYGFKYLNDLVAAGTDTTAYYKSATLIEGLTTENELQRYTNSILETPFKSLRIKITGSGSNNADALGTAILTWFN